MAFPRIYAKTGAPVRDLNGLRLIPDAALRVVVDANYVFAVGVTAGVDAALRLAGELRGNEVAQAIQLDMVYAPEPPFDSGTPERAPPSILERARQSYQEITARREKTARRIAARLGIVVDQ